MRSKREREDEGGTLNVELERTKSESSNVTQCDSNVTSNPDVRIRGPHNLNIKLMY